MTINHSTNFTDLDEFLTMLDKMKDKKVSFSFSGSVNNESENDRNNFSINRTSEEEI